MKHLLSDYFPLLTGCSTSLVEDFLLAVTDSTAEMVYA